MNEDVGAASELDEVVGTPRVPGYDDRSVGRVEAIGEGRHHGRMIHQGRPHLHVLVLEDDAAVLELVNVDQGHERHSSFGRDSRVDVDRVHLEEELRHALERGRSPGINPGAQPGGPREPDQISVVRGVVRVLVGDEDMPESGERHVGEHELASDAVAAINDVRRPIRDDDLGRPRARLPRPRPSAGSEEDEPGLRTLRFTSGSEREPQSAR